MRAMHDYTIQRVLRRLLRVYSPHGLRTSLQHHLRRARVLPRARIFLHLALSYTLRQFNGYLCRVKARTAQAQCVLWWLYVRLLHTRIAFSCSAVASVFADMALDLQISQGVKARSEPKLE